MDGAPVPAQRPGRMPGGDDGTGGRGHRGHAHRGRHRLVDVEEVDALALERPPDLARRRRAEHDVRKRPVRRNDHRPADPDHVRRRRVVPAEPRVQEPGERPRRVVANDRPRFDPEPAQCFRLQLGVLDDGAPEGPGERDDDAQLHRGGVYGPVWPPRERGTAARIRRRWSAAARF